MDFVYRPRARARASFALCLLGMAAAAVPATAVSPPAADHAMPDPTGTLTLREALALALERSPELDAFSWEIRARDARAVQAGRPPNPELRTDVENIGGSGDRERFEDTETTVRVAQLIELGGKRGRRRRLAELGSALATWDYRAKRLHVLYETSRAFIAVLVAQERMALAAEIAALSRRSVEAADARIAAGGAPPVESTRAQVAVANADIERQRVEQELIAARVMLAANWGSREPSFDRVAGDLARISAPPSTAVLRERLAANPDLARWDTELEERRAAVHLEQAQRIPNVTVGAGGRHFSDNGDNAVVLELSIPLPIFNRNDGAIAEAQSRLAKAHAERRAATLAAQTSLATAAARLTAAWERAERLRTAVLPAATRVLDQTLSTYRQGVFTFVQVADAQRALFDLRSEYLTTLETYHLLAADVERLTAAPLAGDTIDGEPR